MYSHEHYIKYIDYYKKYYQSKKGKEIRRKANQKYRKTEKRKKQHRNSIRRTKAKRQRNFGWIQMFENPFDESEQIEWHHITDIYVVAIPVDLHRLYNGHNNHREITMIIIKQIYK